MQTKPSTMTLTCRDFVHDIAAHHTAANVQGELCHCYAWYSVYGVRCELCNEVGCDCKPWPCHLPVRPRCAQLGVEIELCCKCADDLVLARSVHGQPAFPALWTVLAQEALDEKKWHEGGGGEAA